MSTSTNLSIFKVLSILLQYPTQTWLTELPEIESYSTEIDPKSSLYTTKNKKAD